MKRILHISWLIFLFNYALGQTGIISTVVGSGIGGYSGDGGQATSSELDLLCGIALDDSNNIYIADEGNEVVRKVAYNTGIISTIAGTGAQGYHGDGGPATAATFHLPTYVCVDKQFNIYVSDADNMVIRKVTYSTGIINTIVGNGYLFHHARFPTFWGGYSGDGGPATGSELNCPAGIALDDSDNIYFADSYNSVIRKVSNSSGIITTIIGNGYGASTYYPVVIHGYTGDGGPATSAELYWPIDVSIDKAWNLYFTDTYNNVVRKVNTTGIISTVAGNHSSGFGFSGDGGPATSAKFNYPFGVVPDNLGNLYIADVYNNLIRFVDNSTTIIISIAGNFSYGRGYSGDGGPSTSAELNFPAYAVLDTNGNLFISDNSNNVVREVTTPIATGKSEVKKNEDISVFPNPAKNEITVQLLVSPQARAVPLSVMFYDLTGREVLTKKLTKTATIIDCSCLSDSVYLYKITDENGKVIKADKVVVEH